jgi:uncharacterized protein YjiS (DUF1127 family)
MTTTCLTCGRCAGADHPGGLARLLRSIARMLSRPRCRQTAYLLHLDDYLLADIGLSRDEVQRAMRDRRPLRRRDRPEPAALAVRVGRH